MTTTFVHAGAFGDIIYAMPAIKAMGGGRLVMYPLNTIGRWMTEEMAAMIIPLLTSQDYISEAIYSEAPVRCDVNFNHFRAGLGRGITLRDAQLRMLNLPTEPMCPWLDIEPLDPGYPVVIHRSPRYHRPGFDWKRILNHYRGQIIFGGYQFEHRHFCDFYDVEIPRLETDNLLQLARYIKGSKLFIGNQSSPAALAHGMFHPMIQETMHDQNDNCQLDRPDVLYTGGDVGDLPTFYRLFKINLNKGDK